MCDKSIETVDGNEPLNCTPYMADVSEILTEGFTGALLPSLENLQERLNELT